MNRFPEAVVLGGDLYALVNCNVDHLPIAPFHPSLALNGCYGNEDPIMVVEERSEEFLVSVCMESMWRGYISADWWWNNNWAVYKKLL